MANPRTRVAVVLAGLALIAGCSLLRGTRPKGVDLLREQILDVLDLKPGMKVGEIGFGPGWFVIRIAREIGGDGVIYATDIDPARIEALQPRLADIGPARVELRWCRDGRDTALDDLPDGSLDLILMIDSLCFDAEYPRASNVEYLRRFARLLRSGGRLVHHMDCRCDVTTDGLASQFADAGFSPEFKSYALGGDPAVDDPAWPCRSAAERARHAFVGVFRKP